MAPRTRTAAKRPHIVAAVVPPGPSLLELAAAVEVFGIARPHLADPWYELRVCTDRSVETAAPIYGMHVHAPYGLEAAGDADTLIAMPWGGEHHPDGETMATPAVLDVFRAAYERGARLLSFCTGAFVLADAGVLRGRRATTHWQAAEEMAAKHPDVDVDAGVLYVDDGQVLTSAGAAASIDLALHVLRLDHGADIANAVARGLVVPPHRDGGQAQFVPAPVAPRPGPDPFRDTLDWARAHLDEPLSVGDLAARAMESPRSFARHFRAVMGTTPHQWLLRERVTLAQRLLETTEEPVERIAMQAGFGSAATLRMHFQRLVHTTPNAYRRRFCCVGEAAVS